MIGLLDLMEEARCAERESIVTDGGVDNTSKDPFSQCEQLQGIHIQEK